MQASAVPDLTRRTVSLPFSRGGLGIQSASRTHPAAFWASWADGLEMVQQRHPQVPRHRSESIRGVVPCQGIVSAEGFDVPTEGAHPQNPDLEDDSPAPRVGWQRPASSRLERQCASEMWPVFSQTERALMLSQSGPMCGEPFTCFPSIKETRFDPQSFRLLLLRCLRLPLPLTARRCQCGRLLDSCGHHRAACAQVREPRHGYVGKQVGG